VSRSGKIIDEKIKQDIIKTYENGDTRKNIADGIISDKGMPVREATESYPG